MDIFVRSPNWIGDCVMALPALRAIKDYFPHGNIYLVTKHYLAAVFQHIPEIKEIITIPDQTNIRNIFATARILRKYGVQQGILFTNSFSSALLFRLAGIKQLTGYVKDSRGIMLTHSFPFPADDAHHTLFYLDLVRRYKNSVAKEVYPGSGETGGKRYSTALAIDEEEKKQVGARLSVLGVATGRILVGIAPAAAYGSSKQWLPERWQALVHRIEAEWPQVQLLLLGAAKEQAQIDTIIGPGTHPNIINLAGVLNLRETILTISLCHGFIANDSGLMHVAASLNLPLIALFGPTRPEKTAPQNTQGVVIHYPPPCSPCLFRVCPFADHPCMTAITVQEVFEKLAACLPALKVSPALEA